MVFSIFNFFASQKPKPNVERFLKMLWLSQRPTWVSQVIAQLTENDKGIPVLFLTLLKDTHITQCTVEIIKNLLIAYPKPEWNVCQQVSKMLSPENAQIELVCVLAIGSEKSSYNREFYHKIRVLKMHEIGQWRKYLTHIKSSTNLICGKFDRKTDYTTVLFNEPLDFTLRNTSKENDIISLYKGTIYKNKILRSPIEVSLPISFTQRDFHLLVDYMTEPLVIIVKNVDENVVPPPNVYLVYIENSKSFGANILPYVEDLSSDRVLDLVV